MKRLMMGLGCWWMSVAGGLTTAGDAPRYVFEGPIMGVVCSVCAGKVKAKVAEVPGVTEVKIVRVRDEVLPRLRVQANRADLTRQEVMDALKGESYRLESLSLIAHSAGS